MRNSVQRKMAKQRFPVVRSFVRRLSHWLGALRLLLSMTPEEVTHFAAALESRRKSKEIDQFWADLAVSADRRLSDPKLRYKRAAAMESEQSFWSRMERFGVLREE